MSWNTKTKILLTTILTLAGLALAPGGIGAATDGDAPPADLRNIAEILNAEPRAQSLADAVQLGPINCGQRGECNFIECPTPSCPEGESPACECSPSGQECGWFWDEFPLYTCSCRCAATPTEPEPEPQEEEPIACVKGTVEVCIYGPKATDAM